MNFDECPPKENTSREAYEKATDTFIGGDGFIRVLGPPVWLFETIKPRCPSCRTKMAYVASVGYESQKSAQFLENGRPFFPGEFACYFFLCTRCMITQLRCQPT